MKITGLFIYPIKSLAGIAINSALATPQGLAVRVADKKVFDRQWMVVRSNGSFLTQRQTAEMASIRPSLTTEGLLLEKSGMEPCIVPYLQEGSAEQVEVKVWRDICEASPENRQINQWFTNALNAREPLRLVRLAHNTQRPQSKPELLGAETHTNFADAAPYLIANQASLDSLNLALKDQKQNPVDIRRFRPNLLLEGWKPFQEHQHQTLELQECSFKLCYPCQRCIITTINPDTAEKNPDMEPINTLKRINPMPDNPHAPAFGVNTTIIGNEAKTITLS